MKLCLFLWVPGIILRSKRPSGQVPDAIFPNQNRRKGNWIVFLGTTIGLESLIAVGYKQFYITVVLIDVQICWQNRIFCQTVCVKGIQIISLEVYFILFFLLWVFVVVIFRFHAITIILVLDGFLELLLPYRWYKNKRKGSLGVNVKSPWIRDNERSAVQWVILCFRSILSFNATSAIY